MVCWLFNQPHRNTAFVFFLFPAKHLLGTLSCRIQPPGLLLGLVMEFPPLFFTKPWVFSFSHPWLLSCPWFSLFPTLGCYSALGFPLFPSLATIQPLVFHFYPPLAIIPPLACIQQVRVLQKLHLIKVIKFAMN